MMFLLLFGGLTWLLLAGDLLVRGAVALAERAGIPPMVVGLTVVAFGTSAPELFISLRAVLGGVPEVAVGNVIGSNIANVLLVLGLPALLTPTHCDRNIGWDLIFMLVASAGFAVLCLLGPLGAVHGAILLAGIAVVLLRSAREALRPPEVQAAAAEELERVLGLPNNGWMIALFIVVGCVGLPVGADLLVDGAIQIAELLDVSNTVVGLSVVAIGTSLPELATTVVAAMHKNSDVAVGAIVGSNLFNILAVMGITALVSPYPVPIPAEILRFDLPVMLAAAAALAYLAWFRGIIGRSAGTALLAAYAVYIVALYGQANRLTAGG
jgi:cation:H+ antiporter